MSKTKLLSLIILILIIVLFVSTIQSKLSDKKYISQIISEFQNFLYEYDNFDDELSMPASMNIVNSRKDISSITKDEALEDIDYLFSLLKYGYSGYEFFGGDEKFISAKENIIWSVIALNNNIININEFLNLIYSELKFIQDSHFAIGNYKLCNYTRYFSSRKFAFHKDNIGFYTYIDKDIYYLKSINDEEP